MTKKNSKKTSEEILGDEIQSHQHKQLNSSTFTNDTQVTATSNKDQSASEVSSLQKATSSLPKNEQKRKRKQRKREHHSLGLDDESFRRHNLPNTPKRISKRPKTLSDYAVYHVSFKFPSAVVGNQSGKICFMSLHYFFKTIQRHKAIKKVTSSNAKYSRQRNSKMNLRVSQNKIQTQSILTNKQTKTKTKQNRRKQNETNKTKFNQPTQRNHLLEDQNTNIDTMEVTQTNVTSEGHCPQAQLQEIDQCGNEHCIDDSKQGSKSSKLSFFCYCFFNRLFIDAGVENIKNERIERQCNEVLFVNEDKKQEITLGNDDRKNSGSEITENLPLLSKNKVPSVKILFFSFLYDDVNLSSYVGELRKIRQDRNSTRKEGDQLVQWLEKLGRF